MSMDQSDDVARPDAEARQDDSSSDRRRSRVGIALVVFGILFVLGAIPLVVIGLGDRSDASDARDQVSTMQAKSRMVLARAGQLEHHTSTLTTLTEGFRLKVITVRVATAALTDAARAVVDVENRSAARYDSGDVSGAATIWHTDGQSAIDTLTAKNDAAKQAMAAARTAAQAVKDAI